MLGQGIAQENAQDFPEHIPRTKGYFHNTNVGYLTNGDYTSFTFLMVNGYLFNPHLSVGFATGIDFVQGLKVPALIETKYCFLDKNASPFVSFIGGLELPTDGEYDERGFSVGGSIGIRSYLSNRIAFVGSVGYRMFHLTKMQYDWGWEPPGSNYIIYNLPRLELKIGIQFN